MGLRRHVHQDPTEREPHLNPYLLVGLSYLLGATPTSYWIGRFAYGVDLRSEGSGNLGATNAFRVLGWKAALPVMIVDIGKGWLPAAMFVGLDGSDAWAWALAYGAAAIVGHVFSFWVGFAGGKGVATSTGVFLAIVPAALGAGLAVWIVTLVSIRIVSVASLAGAVTIPVVVFLTEQPGGPLMAWFTVGLAAFVFWAHRSNIQRLLRGEEPRIRQRGKGGHAGEVRSAGGPQ